jgi:hypothetical protein
MWNLPTHLFSVYWGLVLQGRDVVYLSSPSAEVRNECSLISTIRVPRVMYLYRTFFTKTIILLVILRSLIVRFLAVGKSLSTSVSRMVKRMLGPAKEQVTD